MCLSSCPHAPCSPTNTNMNTNDVFTFMLACKQSWFCATPASPILCCSSGMYICSHVDQSFERPVTTSPDQSFWNVMSEKPKTETVCNWTGLQLIISCNQSSPVAVQLQFFISSATELSNTSGTYFGCKLWSSYIIHYCQCMLHFSLVARSCLSWECLESNLQCGPCRECLSSNLQCVGSGYQQSPTGVRLVLSWVS